MSDYRIEAATKEEWANRALIAEAKLTKAVELALEECPFRAGTPKYDKWWHHRRDVLAELEGEK